MNLKAAMLLACQKYGYDDYGIKKPLPVKRKHTRPIRPPLELRPPMTRNGPTPITHRKL